MQSARSLRNTDQGRKQVMVALQLKKRRTRMCEEPTKQEKLPPNGGSDRKRLSRELL